MTPLQLRHMWLLGATVLSMAIVLALMWQVHGELRDARKQQADVSEPFISPIYQVEREYLRFLHVLEMTTAREGPADSDALASARKLLENRIAFLDHTPVAADIRTSPEFLKVRARLAEVLQSADANLERKVTNALAWHPLVREMQTLSADMNALMMRAAVLGSARQEQARAQQIHSAQTSLRLMAALSLLLLVSAAAIAVRQGRSQQEREHMQHLYEQMQAANQKAEAANAGKSQFLASMSHELRTPLNGMLGMLSLLESTPVNDQQDDYIKTTRRSANHLLSLLNDLLDASALESGEITLKPESLHLPSLVTDAQALMRPAALEKRIVLTVSLDPALPQWVLADGTRVKQIMLNLLSNALKSSERGTVLLEVFPLSMFSQEGEERVKLCVRVSDEGPGMSAEVMATLFQRFEPGTASGVRRQGSRNLGLEISRNLARRMGGDIEVSSVQNKGSVFTVILPLQRSQPPPVPVEEVAPVRRAPGTPGLNLVVAEDNVINRKYLAALLKNMGHAVRFAEHGGIAVQEIQNDLPDMVLMDLHMPDVDGLQATEIIRRMPAPYSEVPIIALTADVFEESKDRVRVAGMDGFLSKPVNVHELEKMLVQRFGTRGASLATTPAANASSPAGKNVASATNTAFPAVPHAPRQPRRRFRAGDVAEHLNMAMIGELCVGVTLQGYQSLLDGAMRSDAHCYTDLLAALEQTNTTALLELGHAFKGVASSLGLAALSQHALTIEKQGHNFSEEECRQYAATLQDCWNTTYALCERMGLITAP
nr:response regulator [uncultured Rhodoferax sp.]